MKTGTVGTYALPWAETEVDGIANPSADLLCVGASWRRTGQAICVDGSERVLRLTGAVGIDRLRQRAARFARSLGAGGRPAVAADCSGDDGLHQTPRQGFTLTDGRRSYPVRLAPAAAGGAPLLIFSDALPPLDAELWVVRADLDPVDPHIAGESGGAMICFTPGTVLNTPTGPRLIETLHPGDLIQTKDNGAQPVMWRGHRHLTGARLHVMPHLRPVRIRADAFGLGRPDRALIVSPQHRMLVQGAPAMALFNVPEVLVAAQDLLDHRSIAVDHGLRDVTYVHVLLERHQIVWANGLETESFHPSADALDTLDPGQRRALIAQHPGLGAAEQSYGDLARRALSASEAAILRHDLAA